MEIIIIDHEPFSERRKKNYYINDFIDRNVPIEYWAVNHLLEYTKKVYYNFEDQAEYVHYIDTYAELLQKIGSKKVEETIFILEIRFDHTTVGIYKALKDRGFKIVRVDYYFNPTRALADHLTFREKILKLTPSNFVYKFLRIRNAKFNGAFNVYDLLFICGTENNNIWHPHKKLVSLDYFDIEEYRTIKVKPPLLEYKYILFTDIMLLNHPDKSIYNYSNDLRADLYFKKLNLFFSFLEEKTGLPVVIASHPKANYKNEFGDRLCIRGKTSELSIGCEFVITHGSLSIDYALQAKKPIVYFYFNEMVKGDAFLELIFHRMKKACSLLNTVKVNIDELDQIDIDFNNLNIDEGKYEEFLDNFYRKNVIYKDKNNFEIIFDNFKLLLNEY